MENIGIDMQSFIRPCPHPTGLPTFSESNAQFPLKPIAWPQLSPLNTFSMSLAGKEADMSPSRSAFKPFNPSRDALEMSHRTFLSTQSFSIKDMSDNLNQKALPCLKTQAVGKIGTDDEKQNVKSEAILNSSKKIKKHELRNMNSKKREKVKSDRKQGKKTMKREVWTPDDDTLLTNLYEQNGPRWALIASKMQSQKTRKQVRDRYLNNLKPGINFTEFTQEEEALFYSLYQKFGKKWCEIAANMPGRTENQVKNKFYWTNRKCARRLLRVEKTFLDNSPKLEDTSVNVKVDEKIEFASHSQNHEEYNVKHDDRFLSVKDERQSENTHVCQSSDGIDEAKDQVKEEFCLEKSRELPCPFSTKAEDDFTQYSIKLEESQMQDMTVKNDQLNCDSTGLVIKANDRFFYENAYEQFNHTKLEEALVSLQHFYKRDLHAQTTGEKNDKEILSDTCPEDFKGFSLYVNDYFSSENDDAESFMINQE